MTLVSRQRARVPVTVLLVVAREQLVQRLGATVVQVRRAGGNGQEGRCVEHLRLRLRASRGFGGEERRHRQLAEVRERGERVASRAA